MPKKAARATPPRKARKAAPPPAKAWCVYVLRCADGSLYCGMTNVLEKRLAQHTAGTGARYTRGRSPLLLLQSWPVESKSAALKLERRFKKLRKVRKEAVLKSGQQDWMIPAPATVR